MITLPYIIRALCWPTCLFRCRTCIGCLASWSKCKAKRPAGTVKFFAQLRSFWSTFANRENWEYCFEPSLQKRLSTNTNSTTDFYNSWLYGLIWTLKQKTKLKLFFWITFWKFKTILWDLDSENPVSTFRENEFDKREKPLQVTLLPKTAYQITKTGKIFGICLSSNFIHI